MKVILITGTPASGKSTLASRLSTDLGFEIIEQLDFAREKGLLSEYDKKRGSFVVDEGQFSSELSKLIEEKIKEHSKGVIVVGALSHFLPPKLTSLVVVTHCRLSELKERLSSRGYSPIKVSLNLEAEAFDECGVEAWEQGHPLIVGFDTSSSYMEGADLGYRLIRDYEILLTKIRRIRHLA